MRKIALVLIFLSGCAVQSHNLPVRTMHNDMEPMVFRVETADFKNNYRMKFFISDPRKVYLKTEGDNLYMKFDTATAFSPEAASTVQRQQSPCKYDMFTYEDSRLVVKFICETGTKVYPEIAGEHILDIILSKTMKTEQ